MRSRTFIIILFQFVLCHLYNCHYVASVKIRYESQKGSQSLRSKSANPLISMKIHFKSYEESQSSNSYSPNNNPSIEPTKDINPSNSFSPSIEPTRRCFDPDKVDFGAICPLVYKPVCGCNHITYSNTCEAEREGKVNLCIGT
jgi:hypothetical protein